MTEDNFLRFYHEALVQCFPDLQVESIRQIGGGSCRVFEVNSDLIFRFPRDEEISRLLETEVQIVPKLSKSLSHSVPNYTYISKGCEIFPGTILGYPKIPGEAMSDLSLSSSQEMEIAMEIAAFLNELHAFDEKRSTGELGLEPFDPMTWKHNYVREFEKFKRVVFPALESLERSWVTEQFDDFLKEKAIFDFKPVLVHGDFDGSNVLLDPKTKRIAGIIDFEETGLGDPSVDFCVWESEYGIEFLREIERHYRFELDPNFHSRREFHSCRVPLCELEYGITSGKKIHVENGLRRLRGKMKGEDRVGGWA
jgi:aminoglycoside 2''-phosphotransferase